MNKKIFILLVFSLFTSTASAQVEWNDIPLSAGTFVDGARAYKHGQYDINVPAGVGLEFKVAMHAKDTIVYSWVSDIDDANLMDVEFHGHTDPVDGKGDLMFYKIHNEGRGSGVLNAPFTGIHGWYLNNRSDKDVLVQLTVSGFFEESE